MRIITRRLPGAGPTLGLLLSIFAVLAACQRSPAVPVASRTGPGLATGPAASESPGYYVASERGIVLLDAATLEHGKPPRMISMTPARRPRLIAEDRDSHILVFLAPAEAGTEIRRLDASTGDERVLATLPRGLGAECGLDAQSQVAELIHEDGDFTVLPAGTTACLTVQDRKDTMRSVAIAVRVDLGSGSFEQVALMSDTCPVADPTPPAMSCPDAGQNRTPAAAPATLPAPDDAAFPYRVQDGKLVHRSAGGPTDSMRAVVADLMPELWSSSGRWQLCSGGIHAGDSIHRTLVLLDRSQGRFYPLRSGDWPEPVPVEALAGLLASGDDTLVVTGEDPVRALDGDRILAGSLLVIPGKRILDIEGELAR